MDPGSGCVRPLCCIAMVIGGRPQKESREFPLMTSFPIDPTDVECLESCPVCDGATLDRLAIASVRTTVYLETSLCRSCGLTFRSKRPNSDWFDSSWRKREAATSADYEQDPYLNRRRVQRYRLVAQFLRSLEPGGHLVDVGSGPGQGWSPCANSASTSLRSSPTRSVRKSDVK